MRRARPSDIPSILLLIQKATDGAVTIKRSDLLLALGDRWVQADGTISKEVMPDLLHLSPLGYEQWAQGMLPALRELLAD